MNDFSAVLIVDVIDILIVAFLLYRLFSLMRGTRAASMVLGLVSLFVLSVIARWFNLIAVNWLVSSLRTVWVIAFVILFAPELRRALATLGQNRLLGRFVRVSETGVIPEIVRTATQLAEKKVGALIVMEKDMGLRQYVETGTRVDAKVTAELLGTIFTPPSPLHDGAVIIQNDRVVAAGCILPLTRDQRVSQALGTRHRAALGLSEETDAIVIVVSEETGAIAYADQGKLHRKIDIKTLRTDLLKAFGMVSEEKAHAPAAATS